MASVGSVFVSWSRLVNADLPWHCSVAHTNPAKLFSLKRCVVLYCSERKKISTEFPEFLEIGWVFCFVLFCLFGVCSVFVVRFGLVFLVWRLFFQSHHMFLNSVDGKEMT